MYPVPMFDRVLVRSDPADTHAGALELSAPVPKFTGVVVAVGEGRLCTTAPVSSMEVLEDGTLKQTAARRCHVEPLRVKVGDRVFYSPHAGILMKVGTEQFLLFQEDDILMTLREDPDVPNDGATS